MQHGTPSPHPDGEPSPTDDHSPPDPEPDFDQESVENYASDPGRAPDRNRTPSPAPEIDCGSFLRRLLEEALDSSEGSTTQLEWLGRRSDELSDELRRHTSGEDGWPSRQVRVRLINELAKFSELVRKVVRRSDQISELVDRVSRNLEEMDLVPSAEQSGTPPFVLQLDSVTVRRRYDSAGRLRGQWDVFFNEVKVRMSKGLARLAEALAAKEGPSPDQFVGYKTKDALGEVLGIKAASVPGRIYHLRNVLQDEPRLLRTFVHTSEEGSYRIAVRRAKS